MNVQTDLGYSRAKNLTQNHNWAPRYIETSHFTLKSYVSPSRQTADSAPLVVYIEGDGSAFLNNGRTITSDPTPRNPFMLSVATKDVTHEAVYLARPCQYVISEGKGVNCRFPLWTDGRFNEVVVADMNEAVSKMLRLKGKNKVVLVGGSGGATVAMLIAARRNDVVGIVSIVGLLNHQTWTQRLDITPLGQSLNPPAVYARLTHIPQVHMIGADDDIIDPALTISEVRALKRMGAQNIVHKVFENHSHECCWDDTWSRYYRQIIERLN